VSRDNARNNAVECRDCDRLGPIRPTLADARRAALDTGWKRTRGHTWLCPDCRPPAAPHARITLRVPADLVDRLDRAAHDRWTTRNALAAQLLDTGLAQLPPPDPNRLT